MVVLAAGATGACGPTVQVEVAPHAADPLCASVVLALPDELATYARLGTTSQATTAWGDPAAPIVLRCGVEPPGPTTDKCVTATDATGASVDWIAVESDDPDGDSTWTFTTYGREPAVEVSVPPEVTNENSTSFLVDLAPAVTKTTQLRACV
ncbi:DUF3515 domain-containing protein [Pengzhenrongella frigida]|uniref:DUF3515 domain-containing protein n=1 Tax=Pengzhenrongella frigida TaxID=1259133 RepID=A0A4Q5MX95_9MICO|nr:DUF3515 domain-containing protein [Cellulomonas sp. HLT2-17]